MSVAISCSFIEVRCEAEDSECELEAAFVDVVTDGSCRVETVAAKEATACRQPL